MMNNKLTHPLVDPELNVDLHALISAGTANSTRRAYQRDVDYFWTWAQLRFEFITPHYPMNIEFVLRFILDHVTGLPSEIDQRLVRDQRKQHVGPLKVSTIKRYLASLSVITQEHGYPSPLQHDQVKLLLRRARAATSADQQPNKKAAITKDLLQKLLATCDNSLHGIRDKAILLLGFASGGRRRSELALLRVSDVSKSDQGYMLQLRQSKTDPQGSGYCVPLHGEAAIALNTWLIKSSIREGYLFRGIKHNETYHENITGRSINRMIKRRIKQIGLNPETYGAHSLRSGFLTEAGNMGCHVRDAMQLSGHRDTKTALQYYRTGELNQNPATRLLSSN